VVKVGDDLMSATRYGVMMLRYAELTAPPRGSEILTVRWGRSRG
jgi:hypothetical protein